MVVGTVLQFSLVFFFTGIRIPVLDVGPTGPSGSISSRRACCAVTERVKGQAQHIQSTAFRGVHFPKASLLSNNFD